MVWPFGDCGFPICERPTCIVLKGIIFGSLYVKIDVSSVSSDKEMYKTKEETLYFRRRLYRFLMRTQSTGYCTCYCFVTNSDD